MSAGRIVLIGGGVRSGKSAFALQRAKRFGARCAFVATAQPFDGEMEARIARHRAERGTDFVTFEAPRELERAILELSGVVDAVVVDCLTLWLSNLLLDGRSVPELSARVETLAEALRASRSAVVLVTNEVGMGIVPESALGRMFRDVAGWAHQRLAREASELYFATLGTVLRLRPAPVALVSAGGEHVEAG